MSTTSSVVQRNTSTETDSLKVWAWSLVACSVALMVTLAAYFPTALSMVDTWWRSETFAHGFLILPISGYLLWRQRGTLASLSPRPCWWGLVVVAAAGFGWLLAKYVDVLVVQRAGAARSV